VSESPGNHEPLFEIYTLYYTLTYYILLIMAPTSNKKAKGTKPAGKKKAKNPTAALESLQKNTQAARAKYTNAERTRNAYDGYLARGRVILADIVSERRKKVSEDPKWVCPQGIDTSLLEKAFDKPPNKYSAVALELYLTQKCIVEGLGKSTAEGIHSAFSKYWDTM
jgi:hypothetical protein